MSYLAGIHERRFTAWLPRTWSRSPYKTLDFRRFAEELKVLGLFGVTFTPRLYADRLAEALGLEIRLTYIEQIRHPDVLRKLSVDGITGGLVVKAGSHPIAWVIIPESSSPVQEMTAQFHELGHLAGLHAISPRRLVCDGAKQSRDTAACWRPPGQLIDRPPPSTDHDVVETEAEQRAEYSLLTALHGHQIFARYRWLLGHDPRSELNISRV